MPRYRVYFEQINATNYIVSADDERDAVDIAIRRYGTVERDVETVEPAEDA